MPILISKTYQYTTEESAEHGEPSESGFKFEDEPYTFTELVSTLVDGGFEVPSDSVGTPRWLSTHSYHDPHYGHHEVYSLHPGEDARSQRYWAKACRAADNYRRR